MLNKIKKIIVLTAYLIGRSVISQDISISAGKNSIALNEFFTITITSKNENITSYSGFPEIQGFMKRGINTSSMTNFVNGRGSITINITQNYQPLKEGKYSLKPFTMEVNGSKINFNGTTIVVGPPIQAQKSSDPFDDFFWGGGGGNRQPFEYIDIKEDAFFSLETDKKSVYVGEGFTVSLCLYVSKDNKAEMEFSRLGEQVQEFSKKMKCKTCIEENMFISQVSPENVKIGNKEYSRYKFYESTLFPFNNDPIGFPGLSLELVKYKISKQRTFFGYDRQPDKLVLNSKPLVVKVKSLPDHPLRDGIAVGDFKLEETISKSKCKVGEGLVYKFSVYGMGNIASLNKPTHFPNENFEVFEPNVSQKINKGNGTISGRKSWDYYIVPINPGEVSFKDDFAWVYFNTKKAKYDTLRPKLSINVIGESIRNSQIESGISDEFYKLINQTDSKLFKINEAFWYKSLFNTLLVGMLLICFGFWVTVLFTQKKKSE